MSELEERLMEDYKTAMRSGDAPRRDTLRLLRSAVKSAEIDKREPLTDGEVLAVLQRQAKQRQDSIEQFAAGGRDDLVKLETAELVIIQGYLPRQLGRDDIEKIARSVIAEMGASGPGAVGQVMRQVMARLKGQADGKLVNDVVRSLLSQP
jgi:uncharacterized protein YqeY